MPFFPALIAVVTTAVSVIKNIAVIATAVHAVCNIIVSVGKELGLFESDTNPEELGDRALQADHLKPEDFDTYEEYVREIEKFDIDMEKSKLFTKEEKELKGAEIAAGLLLEKYGMGVEDLLILVAKNPDFFNENRMAAYLNEAKDGDIELQDIKKYFENEIKSNDKLADIHDSIINIEKKLDGEKSLKDIEKEILNAVE